MTEVSDFKIYLNLYLSFKLTESPQKLSGDIQLLPIVLFLVVSCVILMGTTVTFCALWRHSQNKDKPMVSDHDTASGKYIM